MNYLVVMSRAVSLVCLSVLCFISTSVRAADVTLGKQNELVLSLPDAFLAEKEEEATLFVMPRKDDLEGPVSMRVTLLRDLRKLEMDEATVRKMFIEFHGSKPESKEAVDKVGNNLRLTEDVVLEEVDGLKWQFQNYSVWVDGFLCTVTVQTVKPRENEPQCAELNAALEKMFRSMRQTTDAEKKKFSETLHQGGYDEEEMEAAVRQARSTLKLFLERLAAKDAVGYAIKVELKEGDASEFVWLASVEMDKGALRGEINNAPAIVKNYEIGQVLTVDKKDVVDWMYLKDRKMHGNYTMRPLIKTMSEEEAAYWKDKLAQP